MNKLADSKEKDCAFVSSDETLEQMPHGIKSQSNRVKGNSERERNRERRTQTHTGAAHSPPLMRHLRKWHKGLEDNETDPQEKGGRLRGRKNCMSNPGEIKMSWKPSCLYF